VTRRRLRALLLPIVLALAAPGCLLPWGDDAPPGGPITTVGPGGGGGGTPEPEGPPLTWGGIVRDALTGDALANATVRLDLAQVRPCARQGLAWTSWTLPVDGNGTFGPYETARPRSDEVAFFVHAEAPGYTETTLHVGALEARAGTHDLTLALHPRANVTGTAPPATVVALDALGFPRVAVADADGRFAFEGARVENVSLVVATDRPVTTRVTPSAHVDVAADGAGWLLQGSVRLESGAGIAADVVAWNGTELASAARANDAGVFALPLRAEPASLRLEARAGGGQWGGVAHVEINGPPALTERVILRPLC
jgi:hypothetical protein